MTDLTLISAVIVVALICGESIYAALRKSGLYERRDTLTNTVMAFLNIGNDLLYKGITFAAISFSHQYAIFDLGVGWQVWVLAFFLQDFMFYWMHRFEHTVRLLWACHVNHHSSEYFNFSVAVRNATLKPFYRFVFFMPITWLGVDPLILLLVFSANQLYTVFLHTQVVGKLGPIEWVFNTPSHHRVHHGSNPKYIDKNMGQVLIIWDRMFGTFQEEDEPVRYGITKNIHTHFIPKVIFHEWIQIYRDMKATTSLRAKLRYLVAR